MFVEASLAVNWRVDRPYALAIFYREDWYCDKD